MKIPSLSEKLSSIGFDTIKEISNNLEEQQLEAQNLLYKEFDERGLASEDYWFDPKQSAIFLRDHKERRLSKMTALFIELDRAKDTGMAIGIEGIKFETQNYIQEVRPKNQNLIICAETLEYFAEMLRAFNDKTLADAYVEIYNNFWGHVISNANKEAEKQKIIDKANFIKSVSNYMSPLIFDADIDSVEELEVYLNSLSLSELKNMKSDMKLNYSKNNSKSIIKEILKNVSV